MPKAPKGKKAFSFTLPEGMADEFIRLFPEQGERTAFLRDVIASAIMFGKREKLSTKVVQYLNIERRENED